MRVIVSLLLAFLLPVAAFAQTGAAPPPSSNGNPDEWKQPPLVNAPDAPTASPQQTAPQTAPTPPPPGYQPQGTQQVPYPYSPYGTAKMEAPPPEIGLMFTEAAFGTLTAAGTAVLTYFFLVAPLSSSGLSPTVGNALFVISFASIPIATAQSEVSLANGSRYYYSESWPAWLSGLGIEAGVVGIYYLMGGFDSALNSDPTQLSPPVLALLVGTGLALPIGQMAVINLTKQPRWKGAGGFGSVLSYDESNGLRMGLPTPTPIAVRTATGPQLGLGLSLAAGRF